MTDFKKEIAEVPKGFESKNCSFIVVTNKNKKFTLTLSKKESRNE